MAQRPQQGYSTKPSKDRQGADKDRHPTPEDDNIHEEGEYKDQHIPLRDPAEGRAPAVIGQNVATYDNYEDTGDPQQNAAALYPQFIPPPCYTIGDEQRDRAAEVEEMGLINWIDAHDSRTEEEKAEGQLQVAGVRGDNVNVVGQGGGRFGEGRFGDRPPSLEDVRAR